MTAASLPARARGLSLIVVLLILVVVAVLGLGAAQMSLLGEKATRYDRDRQIAFEAAEAALVDAQYDITSGPRASKFKQGSLIGFVTGCGTDSGTTGNQGLCLPNATGSKPLAYTVDFTNNATNAHSVAIGNVTGRTFQVGSSGIQPAQKPRYIIEAITDLHEQSSFKTPGIQPLVYRVTAMGFGPTTDTQVVLQMVFRKGT